MLLKKRKVIGQYMKNHSMHWSRRERLSTDLKIKFSMVTAFCAVKHFRITVIADLLLNTYRKNGGMLTYSPFIIAALISFDMARMMGKGIEQKYDKKMEGFASKLNQKMNEVRPFLKPMIKKNISEWDENKYSQKLKLAYDILSPGGK
jgi:hypothetical protein